MGTATLLSLFGSFFPFLLLPLQFIHALTLSNLYSVLRVVHKVPFPKHISDYICLQIKKKIFKVFYCIQEKGQILFTILYSGPSIGLEYSRQLMHVCWMNWIILYNITYMGISRALGTKNIYFSITFSLHLAWISLFCLISHCCDSNFHWLIILCTWHTFLCSGSLHHVVLSIM